MNNGWPTELIRFTPDRMNQKPKTEREFFELAEYMDQDLKRSLRLEFADMHDILAEAQDELRDLEESVVRLFRSVSRRDWGKGRQFEAS